MGKSYFCSKCNRTLDEDNFYQYKDGTKCELCKPCLTMHVNNFDPSTFLWILEKFDLPWIEPEWNALRDRYYQKDPYKMNGMTVFGRYLSKMKLKQNIDPKTGKYYGWADTERLKEERERNQAKLGEGAAAAQQRLEAIKKAYENGEITEAQYKTYAPEPEPEPLSEPAPVVAPPDAGGPPSLKPGVEEVELADIGAELTMDDKVYLAMKWGKLYRPDEWVALEQLYKEFMDSFDIQGAARIDTLKMICKTSLKMNQAIDVGDVDTYQKLSRVYDAMMKAAKFTEAQKKEEALGEFDSVGQIVYFAEKEKGAIPRHDISIPLDIVDQAIANLKKYNHDLVVNDPALSQMFENYIRRRENAEAQKADLQKAKAEGLDYVEVKDADYLEFNALLQEQSEADDDEYGEGE